MGALMSACGSRMAAAESVRRCYLNEPNRTPQYPDNAISNHKYTPLTFLPKNLSEQFSRHMNRYFLLIAILQLWPSITPVDPITTWGPLLLVFTVSAAKEGYDDVLRHRADRAANTRTAYVLRRGTKVPVAAQDIRVGNLVWVPRDTEVPADLLLLQTSSKSASATGGGMVAGLETASIDGETDIKSRFALRETASLPWDVLANLGGEVEAQPPNADVHKFDSTLRSALGGARVLTIAVSGDQLLQQATVLRNTDWAVGVAVYTGNETKVGQNKSPAPTKVSKADVLINRFTFFVFCFQLVMAAALGFTGHFDPSSRNVNTWYLRWTEASPWASLGVLILRFLLLSSMMIPISLKVTLDIVKAVYSLLINWDVKMYNAATDTPAHANNTAISEDLGTVKYVLTDKTGTLTDNVMSFKVCSVAGAMYGDATALLEPDDGEGAAAESAGRAGSDGRSHGAAAGAGGGAAGTVSSTLSGGGGGDGGAGAGAGVGGGSGSASASPRRHSSSTTAAALVPGCMPLTASAARDNPWVGAFLRCMALNSTVEVQDASSTHGGDTSPTTGGGGLNPDTKVPRVPSSQSQQVGGVTYAAASPDEEALALGAASAGVVLLGREPRDNHTERVTLRVTDPHAPLPSPVSAGGGASASVGDLVGSTLEEHYEILHVLEFTSERRRMSVVVRASPALVGLLAPGGDACEGGIVVLTKGADDVVLSRLAGTASGGDVGGVGDGVSGAGGARTGASSGRRSSRSRSTAGSSAGGSGTPTPTVSEEGVHAVVGDDGTPVDVRAATSEHLEAFASRGLRTLVMAYRAVPQAEYTAWKAQLDAAQAQIGDARGAASAKVYAKLERKLTLLGCSAIEDRLQEGVPDALRNLRRAGVRFWMLTGDKFSTAVQVATAANLMTPVPGHGPDSPHPAVVAVRSGAVDAVHSGLTAARSAQRYLARRQLAFTLIIEGAAVEIALRQFPELLLEVGARSASVICCRAAPKQKASLVRLLRGAGHSTLAIGDGGNDCAMIIEADVGVGISGREGQQAARAADYTLARFSYLERLLLVHGRYSMYRTAFVAQYCFYKSLFICFQQLLFNSQCAYSGCSLLSTYSLTTYNMFFTSLPPLFFCLDRDRPLELVVSQPRLYKEVRDGLLTATTFRNWFLRALAQSVVIFVMVLASVAMRGGDDASSMGQQEMAFVAFTICVLVQGITVSSEALSPTFLQHAANAVCLAAFAVLTALFTETGISIGDYGVFGSLFRCWPCALTVTVTTLVATAPWLVLRMGRRIEREAAESRMWLGAKDDGSSDTDLGRSASQPLLDSASSADGYSTKG